MKQNTLQRLLTASRYMLLLILAAALAAIIAPRVAIGAEQMANSPDAQEPNAIPFIRGLGRVSTTGITQLDEDWMTVAQTTISTAAPAKLLVILDGDLEVTGGGWAIVKLRVDGEFITDPISGAELGARIVTDSLERLRASTSISYLVNLGPGTHTVEIVAKGDTPGIAYSYEHTGFTYLLVR